MDSAVWQKTCGRRPHIVVVGGGIAGLTTAFALTEQANASSNMAITCTVLEAQPRWGGKILTKSVADRILELGPDSFLTTKPWALDLCKKLGLESALRYPNPLHNRTFVYSRGRLREFPPGLIAFVPTRLTPLLLNGLISWKGVLRMLGDWVLPPSSSNEDESLATFFSRRLGNEAFDRLIEPLVAGIYAGDANELSARAICPRFVQLEQQYGGLIKGILSERRATPSRRNMPPSTMFVTLREGLSSLVTQLTDILRRRGIRLLAGQSVECIEQVRSPLRSSLYRVVCDHHLILHADAVVLATPAFISAKLLRDNYGSLAACLDEIPYTSTITLSFVISEGEVRNRLQGYGFVVPRVEHKSLLAATWTSLKWPDRAKQGELLVRCYLGGRGKEALLHEDDQALMRLASEELSEIVGVPFRPQAQEIFRWHAAMPQYTIGHNDRLARIQKYLGEYPGVFLTGAAYEGVGIPDCIRHAYETAQCVFRYVWQAQGGLEKFPKG
ncbi:MAG: protoporphyrinogen oxidase [Nitrospirae bacterium]|nr:MAG: protoporphyrinogen oxidase [Nitrospirota bacterium]